MLEDSPGAAIFGQGMLFDVLFIADWQKIGEHRQQLTNHNNALKTMVGLVMITKMVRKCCYEKKVSSAMKSPGIRKSLG
jgi:hypothetical protein